MDIHQSKRRGHGQGGNQGNKFNKGKPDKFFHRNRKPKLIGEGGDSVGAPFDHTAKHRKHPDGGKQFHRSRPGGQNRDGPRYKPYGQGNTRHQNQQNKWPQNQQHGRSQNQQHGRPQNQLHGRPQNQQHGRPQNQQHGRPQNQLHGRPQNKQHGRPQNQQHGRPQNQQNKRPQSQQHERPQNHQRQRPHNQSHQGQQNQPLQRSTQNMDDLFATRPSKIDYCLAPERLEAQQRALKRFEQQERQADQQQRQSEKDRRHKLMTMKTKKGQPVMQGRMELLYEKVLKMAGQG